ncbi:GNAT family N-acetyltransferase [Microbacterium invictum]|uniref:RimJ/RimL family protein N-acetyltransferase n=1 Tax=Microbacterium invictum TaxID=515415 RepID=A0AA40VMM8_9MICO|nr:MULTISPECIES: GNAT family N-acetyltransferase [Microbacterium]MBB4139834.1 RimJ/RimL family protein N-acetyltransferase [Microbacterium invictum]
MQPVTLHTERLELSVPTADDVDEIYTACQDPRIQQYTTVPVPYERTHAEGFIDLAAGWWDAGSETTWAIRHHGRLVGMIGVHHLGKGDGEIGYWMAPDARGAGILTEAARAVIDWAFAADGLGLARLEWRAVAGNTASARSARALGFRYEGLLRRSLVSHRGHEDGWVAGLLPEDDRIPQPWPVLPD